MYGYSYDPSDDPRFKEDLKPAEDTRDEFDKDAKFDSRDEDMNLAAREEDTRNEQLREAYEIVRDSISYDEFRNLQGELRAGKVTNEDILEMARDISKERK